MSDAYEKDISARTNDRNLILLGCRADADINHRDKKLIALQAALDESTKLFRKFQEMEGFIFEDSGKMRARIQAMNNEMVNNRRQGSSGVNVQIEVWS